MHLYIYIYIYTSGLLLSIADVTTSSYEAIQLLIYRELLVVLMLFAWRSNEIHVPEPSQQYVAALILYCVDCT